MTKIMNGVLKLGIVYVRDFDEQGKMSDIEVSDCQIIGTISLEPEIPGFVIISETTSLFIVQNPASATTELLKVLIAAINQLCLLIDQNLPLIATGITSAGGTYTPVLTTPIMQPVVQAATQLQQMSTPDSPTPSPELPLPSNIDELSSVQIDELIDKQEQTINMAYKALGTATAAISEVLAPIMGIVNLITSFSNAAVNATKASVQQAKDLLKRLKEKRKEAKEEEQTGNN